VETKKWGRKSRPGAQTDTKDKRGTTKKRTRGELEILKQKTKKAKKSSDG